MKNTKFAFTGAMFAGKDFVAEAAGLTRLSLAAPIYDVVEHYTGYSRAHPNVPGVRRLWQLIGQWGWGAITEEYNFSPERIAVTHQIREYGHTMSQQFSWVDWREYGKRKDFWVRILVESLKDKESKSAPVAALFPEEHPDKTTGARYAITNLRFDHEFEPLTHVGFKHFHILCSDTTRTLRMLNAGCVINEKEQNDASEQLAKRMAVETPERQVIWNDDLPIPQGKKFLTVADFVKMSHG